MVGGGVVLSALAPAALASTQHGRPPAAFGKGDVGILNYALTLEYLEAAFYNGATAANLSLNAAERGVPQGRHRRRERHVAFLKKALGKKAVKQPKFDFKGSNTDPAMFMATAEVLENTGVHAYSGQALNIKDGRLCEGGGLDPHDRGAPRKRDRASRMTRAVRRSLPTGRSTRPSPPRRSWRRSRGRVSSPVDCGSVVAHSAVLLRAAAGEWLRLESLRVIRVAFRCEVQVWIARSSRRPCSATAQTDGRRSAVNDKAR